MGSPRLDSTTRQIIFGNLNDLALSSSTFDNVRVWFNNKGWAASVAYMNAANNIVLRYVIIGSLSYYVLSNFMLSISELQ